MHICVLSHANHSIVIYIYELLLPSISHTTVEHRSTFPNLAEGPSVLEDDTAAPTVPLIIVPPARLLVFAVRPVRVATTHVVSRANVLQRSVADAVAHIVLADGRERWRVSAALTSAGRHGEGGGASYGTFCGMGICRLGSVRVRWQLVWIGRAWSCWVPQWRNKRVCCFAEGSKGVRMW